MAFYTVHLPPDARTPDEVAEKATFVKEGFAFFGFAFGGIWLLYQRLWLHAIGYALVLGLLFAAFRYFALPMQFYSILTMLMGALVGLEGHEWMRRNFIRKGWSHAGTVSGPSLAECERRFFKNWLEQGPTAAPYSAPVSVPQGPMPAPPTSQVLGLFPDPRKLPDPRTKA